MGCELSVLAAESAGSGGEADFLLLGAQRAERLKPRGEDVETDAGAKLVRSGQ